MRFEKGRWKWTPVLCSLAQCNWAPVVIFPVLLPLSLLAHLPPLWGFNSYLSLETAACWTRMLNHGSLLFLALLPFKPLLQLKPPLWTGRGKLNHLPALLSLPHNQEMIGWGRVEYIISSRFRCYYSLLSGRWQSRHLFVLIWETRGLEDPRATKMVTARSAVVNFEMSAQKQITYGWVYTSYKYSLYFSPNINIVEIYYCGIHAYVCFLLSSTIDLLMCQNTQYLIPIIA